MASNNRNTTSPTPSSCQKENESLENDDLIEGSSCGNMKKESTFNLHRVTPFNCGEGLPYAPEGWPNRGDIWGWKVGGRTNKSGYYCDRYLYLPTSLRQEKQYRFQSKPEVERYVKTNFPNMELDAFFALFSWKVPSTEMSPTKAAHSSPTSPSGKSLENRKVVTEDITTERKLKRKAQLSNQCTQKSSRHGRSNFPPVVHDMNASNDIIDLSSLNEEEPLNATTEGNFYDYLINTFEGTIVLPETETETSLSDSVIPATTLENEITECRKNLSSFLSVDFPSLVSSNNVAEAATLASQLQKDLSVSVDQLIKLLVEEMLLLHKAFLEAKGNMEEADKFFAELEAKKFNVRHLKNECKELTDKVAQIEAEIETSSKAIQEIDDQILLLESKRNQMSSVHETMHKRKAELTSKQIMVANSIPTIVSEIQNGDSEKRKWELKKANSAQRIAEIQKRFSSLRGLTF